MLHGADKRSRRAHHRHQKGMAIRFKETDARLLGRTARGVRAINLSDEKDDSVIGCAVVEEGKALLTVTETGFGRVSEFDNYRLQSRGGKGLINYHTEKFGDVAAVAAISAMRTPFSFRPAE